MKTRSRLSLIAIMLLFGFKSLAAPTNSFTISASPSDTICSGTSVVFTASVTGTYGSGTYSYIWNVNGTFVGSTTATYTSTTLANGDEVHCVLTNAAGDTIYAVSDTVTMVTDSLAAIPAITGLDSVCIGDSVHLSDATPGGAWATSNNTAATISSDGTVYGLSVPIGGGGGGGGGGSIRITYLVTNGCGTDSVRVARFYVRAPASPIAGSATSICIDSTVALSDASTGGAWSISNTAIASFPPFAFGGQTATGNAAGTVTISYDVNNACGTFNETYSLTVINCDTTLTGVKQVNSLADGCNIYPNPSAGNCTVMVRSAKYSEVSCVISNMVGEKVKTITLNTNQENAIDMGASPGIYFITISAGNEKYTSKLVVIQ